MIFTTSKYRSVFVFSLAVAASMGCAEGVDILPPPIPEPTPAPQPGICDNLPYGLPQQPVSCDPGEEIPGAYCLGYGTTGKRVCDADGMGRSSTYCPYGSASLNQEARNVVVTRDAIRRIPGFEQFIGAISRGSDNQTAVVTVEDAVKSFARPTVPESIRALLQHLRLNELPNMDRVTIVGETTSFSWTRGKNIASSWTDKEVPLWYIPAPAGTRSMDLSVEQSIPSTYLYGYLRGPWRGQVDVDNRFWTPNWQDVSVGYLPLVEENLCDENGANCQSALSAYANKLAGWRVGPMVESHFYGERCAGQTWEDPPGLWQNGVTKTIKTHDCSNGETGQMGDLATADGSTFLMFKWHGNADGSWNETVDGKLKGYAIDRKINYRGICDGHSCSTAFPDQLPSMGGDMVSNPKGPMAYIGYTRILIGNVLDPSDRVLTAGRYTVGEAVDGMIYDALSDQDVASRWEQKELQYGTLLYGDPAVTMAARPATTIKSLVTRPRTEGGLDVCVQVMSDVGGDIGVYAGGRELTRVTVSRGGGVNVPVTLTKEEADSKLPLTLDGCDPTVQACAAAELMPLPMTQLECSELTKNADDSVDLQVKARRMGIGGNGLHFRVKRVSYACSEGRDSYCYVGLWSGARREEVMADLSIAELQPDGNRLTFNVTRPTVKDELFRAFVVELVGFGGQTIAKCPIPMTEKKVEELGLM